MVPDGFFQNALNQSFPEFVRSFAETVYGPDLVGDTLSDIDNAVSKHFARTVADLPTLVSGELRDVASLPLLRTDLNNLKTILRGKISGLSPEEISARLVGGTLKEPIVKALLQCSDAASMAQILQVPGHPLAKALRNAVAGSQDPLALEVALDRDFFSFTFEKAKKLGQTYITGYYGLEVDATNLATAYKLQNLGNTGNIDAFFIPGGRHVNRALFGRVAEGDFAALDTLGPTPFGAVTSVKTLGELELALRKILLDKASKGGVDSLGGGLILDYVRSKEWEAAKIRLLARRAYFNLPVEAVAKEVA